MNVLSLIRPASAKPILLGELFYEARQYGTVSLHTADDGRYWAKIKFASIQHTRLETDSPFVASPEEALQVAIDAAKKVMEQFK